MVQRKAAAALSAIVDKIRADHAPVAADSGDGNRDERGSWADLGDRGYPDTPAPKKRAKSPPSAPVRDFLGGGLAAIPTGHRDTPEQAAIIEALPLLLPGQVLLVQALAGTGKTTLLVRVTETYAADWHFLYLAYNADIAKHAEKRFGENATVKTTHGLAFNALGIRSWLNVRRLGNLRRWEIERWLKTRLAADYRLATGARLGSIAADLLASIRRFCHSAEPALALKHCWPGEKRTQRAAWIAALKAQNAVDPESAGIAAWNRYRQWLLEQGQVLWARLIDPDEASLTLEHDVYLKLYQLSQPKLDYPVILMDEGQDANACVMDLFLRQTHAVLVVVADPNQAVYGFRGATGMGEVAARTMPLSQSHRFGLAVANVANQVLAFKSHHFGGFLPVRGSPVIASVISAITNAPYTVICRSNRGVFRQALAAVSAGLRINSGAKDLEGAIRYIESVWALLTGNRIAQWDPEVQEFESAQQLLDEAESDHSLKWVVQFVAEHGDDLADVCGRLRAAKTRQKKQADVLLITAHKSKGLEFDRVVLADDFAVLDTALEKIQQAEEKGDRTLAETLLADLPTEELNLLYVAVTRARLELQHNTTLDRLLALQPVLQRMQTAAGYVPPNPLDLAAPEAEPLVATQTGDVSAEQLWATFPVELQDAMQGAAAAEGWTMAGFAQEVVETRRLIEERHFCPAFLGELTALYRQIGRAEA